MNLNKILILFMPQMSPMNWFLMMFFVLLNYMILMTYIYFFFSYYLILKFFSSIHLQQFSGLNLILFYWF